MYRSGALPLLFILSSTTLFHITSSMNLTVVGRPTFLTPVQVNGGDANIMNVNVNGTVYIEDNGIYPPCIKADSLNYGTLNGKPIFHNPKVRLCNDNDDKPVPGDINNGNPGNYPAYTNHPCYIDDRWLDPRQRRFEQLIYGERVFKCYRSNMKGLQAIAINSVLYEYLKCNPNDGWRGVNTVFSENGQINNKDYRIGNAYIMPQIKCVEYCVPPTSGYRLNSVPDIYYASWIQISCQTGFMGYGEKNIEENSANCMLEYGWYNGNGLITTDTTTKPQIECRNYREDQRSTTTTTAKTPEGAITSTTTTLPPSLTEKKPIENSKFAASEADAPGVSTATIIGCSIGGIALFAIAGVVIFLMVKKRQSEDGSGIEQGKRTKENNDEILDEIKVESTSEVNA